MCILFIAVNAHAKENEYKLILASNRDEFYMRRARPAHCWDRIPDILGGMDMEPGREGGTWLAMHKVNGRIGVLLNITTPSLSSDKKGRGSLVPDFLESSDPMETVRSLQQEAEQYNPFNLVMIDGLSSSALELLYFTSVGQEAVSKLHPVGVYGFGNSVISTPYQKVQDGRNRFEELVKNFPTFGKQEELTEGILEILKSTHRHLPDPQLKIQARTFSKEMQESLSCRFVCAPFAAYGTRTHTIIYVTGDNLVEFKEWTMKEDCDTAQPEWIYSSYQFKLPVSV